MDQTFNALVEDLDQRGLLDETLVIMFSEFGHTQNLMVMLGETTEMSFLSL